MLTVLPEYRRQGLAITLAERSKEQAIDLGYKVIRMDCINPYEYVSYSYFLLSKYLEFKNDMCLTKIKTETGFVQLV